MVNEVEENRSMGHLSRLAISRMLAGEGPQAGSQASPLPAQMAAHLAGCSECQGAVSKARTQSESIVQRFPTFTSLDTVMRRRKAMDAAGKANETSSPFRYALASLDRFFRGSNGSAVRTAFATLLVLGLGTWVWRYANLEKENGYAAKGAGAETKNAFFLFLNGTQAYGDTLQAGPADTLQLGIVSQRPVHYAVLFRDDGNAVGAYMGGSENKIAPLGNLQGEPLPRSLILEGAWKREILYCIWAERPFTIEEAKRRIDGPAAKVQDLNLQTIVLRNLAP